MPILDIQRRVAEVGRIRIGSSTRKTKNGKEVKIPNRLSTFRLTSPDRARLEAAAELYGGTVLEWEERRGEFVLDTTTNELPVVVTPGGALSQWWETWSGGECKRRCDGERETLSDGGCQCPADYTERRELAAQGKACKPTTRLNVILRDVPGVGYWRFESHGFYAAVELAGALEVLEEATRRGVLLPARLRFSERVVVRGGQTSRFPVPSLDVDVTIGRLAAIARQGVAGELVEHVEPELLELEAGDVVEHGYTPAPARGGVSVRDGLDAANRQTERKTSSRSAAPIGQSRRSASTAPVVVPGDVDVDAGGAHAASDPAAAGGTAPAATPAAPTPETPAPSRSKRSSRAKSTSDVLPVGDDSAMQGEPLSAPAPDVNPEDPFPGSRYATQAQAQLVHVRASKAGVTEEELDRIILDVTEGRTSSAKLVPFDRIEYLLALVDERGAKT